MAWQMNQNLEIEKMACNFDFVFSQNYVPRYGGHSLSVGGGSKQQNFDGWVGMCPQSPHRGKPWRWGQNMQLLWWGWGAEPNLGGTLGGVPLYRVAMLKEV